MNDTTANVLGTDDHATASTVTVKEDAVTPEQVEEASFAISEALSQEGIQPEGLAKDARALSAIYKGYKNAYRLLHEEVGHLRAYSAPYIRPDADVVGLEDKPSIFIVTLPKSATVYIANSISSTLKYRLTNTLVTPMFPKNVVWSVMIHDFQRGGMVSASHMQADRQNMASVKQAGLRKGVLHIRDPRAALLSWVHFVFKKGDMYHFNAKRIENPAGRALNKLPFEERVDGCMETFFYPCVDWIADWIREIEADSRMNFLVVHHEDLVADEAAYFGKIMSFYGINAKVGTVDKNETTHFRSGDNDEWRTVFTPAQIQRMNEAIPDWMWDRFGWAK
tara:strand:- start:103 stop:1110 length:1008 start_codon:yes stop_codon:yes gene_type:complete